MPIGIVGLFYGIQSGKGAEANIDWDLIVSATQQLKSE
jgi:hypothetical protein